MLLKLPERDYFNSYAIAKQAVDDSVEAHSSLVKMYDRHEKYFAGETSKTLEERKKSGLGWMDCWNYGKASQMIKSLVMRNVEAFRESLFLSSPKFYPYKSSMGKEMMILDDVNLTKVIGDCISSCLSTALEADSRTGEFIRSIEYPSLTFGWCAVQCRNNDWLPEVFHPRHITFPTGTRVSDIRRWFTYTTINAADLYNIWVTKRREETEKSEDGSTGDELHIASNYVLEGIEEALWVAFSDKYDAQGNPTSQYKSWSDIIQNFNDNSQYIIQNSHDIYICKIFNRELDKTISETWIAYNKEAQETKHQTAHLMFKKNHGSKGIDDVLVIVKDSGFTDDGKIVKLGGISKMAVQDGLRYDNMRNMVQNKAKVVGMPYLQTNNAKDDVTNKIKVTGGFGVLMDGASFVEHQPSFDISSHIQLLNHHEQEYRNLTDEYNDDPTRKLSSRPTKGEIGVASASTSSMQNAKFQVKLPDYAKIVLMLLNGLCEAEMEDGDAGYKSQKLFFDELINKLTIYGFSTKSQCIKLIKKIAVMPVDYYGMPLDTLRSLMAIAETPQSRIRVKRLMLVRMGIPRSEIDLHAPYEASGYRSFEDDALIAIENNMFTTTDDVVYSDSHDPIMHASGHLQKAVEIFESVQNDEVDVINAFKIVSNILVHNEKHINYIKGHPFYSIRYEEFANAQKVQTRNALDLKVIAEKEMRNRAQRQQEQEQVQQPDQVEETKARVLQERAIQKAQRDEFLTMQRMRTKEAQREFGNQLKVKDQEFSMELREREAAQKNRIMLLQSASKLLK